MANTVNYEEIVAMLPKGKTFTAKEVGIAAATLNAMERRGLVRAFRMYSPVKYEIQNGFTYHQKVLAAFKECANSDGFAWALKGSGDIKCYMVEVKNGRYYDYKGDEWTPLMTRDVTSVKKIVRGVEEKVVNIEK